MANSLFRRIKPHSWTPQGLVAAPYTMLLCYTIAARPHDILIMWQELWLFVDNNAFVCSSGWQVSEYWWISSYYRKLVFRGSNHVLELWGTDNHLESNSSRASPLCLINICMLEIITTRWYIKIVAIQEVKIQWGYLHFGGGIYKPENPLCTNMFVRT